MEADESEESSRGPVPKVQRVIRAYGLEGLEEELGARWQGRNGQRESLRELAANLNQTVLGAAMRDSGMRPVEGEVENLYRLLTADDVSTAQRTEAEAKLKRSGIDPDSVRADFVSHQAVHTYLRDHLDVRLPESGHNDKVERAAETIQRTAGRLRTVAARSLDWLSDEEIVLSDADVFVSIQVYCNECGRQFEMDELLDRGGCDCESI